MAVNQIENPNTPVGTHKNVRIHKDVRMVLVEFTDRDGLQKTKLAVIIGGQEVRFLNDDALSGQVQSWLADNILIATGLTPPKG